MRQVFGLEPIPSLCRYTIHTRPEARDKAHRYLRQVCRVSPGEDGRYPVVLLHYEGNTSAELKNLSHDLAQAVCEEVINSGHVPIILDWDRRSPLPDGKRIYNPHSELELWGGNGTGDAEVLAALTELSSLMIGVDSGPLHVAGATSTPTLGIWTRHHPLHYFGHSDNVTHLVPENHEQFLRGDRAAGGNYFREHYRYQTYQELEPALMSAVRDRLQDAEGALVYTRNYWIRNNNAQQDLVVVKDIAEDDSYRIDELPMPRPVVVDVGAHIGCFSKRLHDRNPLARLIAVECCPENMPALNKNVGGFATVEQAAVTYDEDVALLNAVFPGCVSTGGSRLVSREELARLSRDDGVGRDPKDGQTTAYWTDRRSIKTLTIEQIMDEHDMDRIHVLKLDCEGSEFSILENTSSLDRIDFIIGEYHGRERFDQLVKERFQDWELRILREGELGTFWLVNPQRKGERDQAGTGNWLRSGRSGPVRHAGAKASGEPPPATPPLLVAALRSENGAPRYDLLLLDEGSVRTKYEHPQGWLRGFTRLNGMLWTIDSRGNLYTVDVGSEGIAVHHVSSSKFAREAHDLSVFGRWLVTAGPTHNCVALYEPRSDRWMVQYPWGPTGPVPDNPSPDDGDRYHINSVIHDGESFLLSMFTSDAKPPDSRWRDFDLSQGLIVRWPGEGSTREPWETGIYAPHSLRLHDGRVWWCDSFRGRICREDGWRSPQLGGLTRGLRFVNGRCVVGLSMSRVAPNPQFEVCGLCLFDPEQPDARQLVEIPPPYFEIYDVFPVPEFGGRGTVPPTGHQRP